jgi:large subunit ribosomal protein L13
MTVKTQKTYSAKSEEIQRRWFLVDAQDKILGRLATRVARILTGKDKPVYTPHLDCGDHVVIINADKVQLTGKKLKNKIYYRHTGYIGHLKAVSAEKMMEEKPEEVIYKAVHGMVPKHRLGRQIMGKLRVYRGADHPHGAQKPEIIEVD